MLDQVAAAFDRQDYRTAARLLKELLKQSPQNPWVQLYVARLQEVSGKLDSAESVYRRLLRDTANPKLAIQARQGIQRVEQLSQERQQQAIAEATAAPESGEPGFLILGATAEADRNAAVKELAQRMKLDAYTARMILPNRGWRFYRTGAIGELQLYGQDLRQAGIPAFWASLTDLQSIKVFRVRYFQTAGSQITAVCQNDQDQLGSLTFNGSEVRQRVEGMLPIFEQVLDVGLRNQLERKEQTQDYALFCDLHLPDRRCILRLQDSQYQFDQGVSVLSAAQGSSALDYATVRSQWNALLDWVNQSLPNVRLWSDFTSFGESTADFGETLQQLNSHIHLLRQVESHWDPAFHLYSSMIFLWGDRGSMPNQF